jgi:hypothetical protein
MLQALDAGKLPLTDFRLLVNKACAVLGRIKGALTLPEAEALAMQAPVAPENLKDGPAAFSPEVVALLAAVLATARHASAGEVKVTKEGGS